MLVIWLFAAFGRAELGRWRGPVVGTAILAVVWNFVCLIALDNGDANAWGPLWFVWTLPPLVAALILWLLVGRGKTWRTLGRGLAVLAAATMLIAGIGVWRGIAWEVGAPERAAQAERNRIETETYLARQERNFEAVQAAELARLRGLGPDARLDDLLAFSDQVREAEIRRLIPSLTNRQADAERLLAAQTPIVWFRWIGDFGLTATPALCNAYRNRPEWREQIMMEPQIHAIRWFMANGCDLRPRIGALREEMRRAGTESPGPDGFAAQLDRLLQPAP